MSRHRDIRNMNIQDELDDDALDDGDDYDMTPEQIEQMNQGLEELHRVLGGEAVSGIPDRELQDALWHYYFDVDQTIEWAYAEQERRHVARERKDATSPTIEPYEDYTSTTSSPMLLTDHIIREHGGSERKGRFPLIALAQQRDRLQRQLESEAEQQYQEEDSDESSSTATFRPMRRTLTTISERTERSEPPYLSPDRRGSHRGLGLLHTPRLTITSRTTSYGEVVEGPLSSDPLDPDLIPVSPSDSAIQRLSAYDPPPSPLTVESTPPRSPSVPVPPLENIPDIPDLYSKSNVNGSSRLPTGSSKTSTSIRTPEVVSPSPTPQSPMSVASKQLPPTPSGLSSTPPSLPPKKSKLSLLASSRASRTSLRTESSLSSGTQPTDTIKTYSVLRPSSQSLLRQSGTIAPIPEVSTPTETNSVANSGIPSSTSSHVRRAIQVAMEKEAVDQGTSTTSPMKPISSFPPQNAESPSQPSSYASGSQPSSSPKREKRTSKLAMLAQAKAAQATLQQPAPPRGPKLPKEKTLYLTPVANGPTATTAITTSYQSLYSITDPNQREQDLDPHSLVPLFASPPQKSPEGQKTSKLAMKARKAQEKHTQQPEPTSDYTPILPSVFVGQSLTSRASPSLFASVLVDNESGAQLRSKLRYQHSKKSHGKEKHKGATDGEDGLKKKARKAPRRSSSPPPPPSNSSASSAGFKFNSPSPDDVVFNARKGTSLAKDASYSSSRSTLGKSSSQIRS